MITYLANPKRFLKFEKIATPVFGGLAAICFVIGVWLGLFASPADEVQGESVRIMYVHVPAAYGASMAYAALAIASLVSFVWRHVLADSAARAFAVSGAVFTFLALVTGSLWGKPTWGTWWEWDGRMTSVLVLLFIYIAYLSLWAVMEDNPRTRRIAAIFAMVGAINLPIIKFSVDWWNTLHQPATLSSIDSPGLPPEMAWPLAVMLIAYTAFFAWVSLRLIKTDILQKQSKRQQQKPAAKITLENL